MDVGRQVQYWQEMAEYDMATAGLLVGQKRVLPGLFFCHLAIEKYSKPTLSKKLRSILPGRTTLPCC
ncbi:MAG: HEPN domain-containing protein [Saprospiraceae bacterium]|nr:MAG: HEPN domain-containing protein [Saprospiraceae bacterium]